jgi:hypothetical protein
MMLSLDCYVLVCYRAGHQTTRAFQRHMLCSYFYDQWVPCISPFGTGSYRLPLYGKKGMILPETASTSTHNLIPNL